MFLYKITFIFILFPFSHNNVQYIVNGKIIIKQIIINSILFIKNLYIFCINKYNRLHFLEINQNLLNKDSTTKYIDSK